MLTNSRKQFSYRMVCPEQMNVLPRVAEGISWRRNWDEVERNKDREFMRVMYQAEFWDECKRWQEKGTLNCFFCQTHRTIVDCVNTISCLGFERNRSLRVPWIQLERAAMWCRIESYGIKRTLDGIGFSPKITAFTFDCASRWNFGIVLPFFLGWVEKHEIWLRDLAKLKRTEFHQMFSKSLLSPNPNHLDILVVGDVKQFAPRLLARQFRGQDKHPQKLSLTGDYCEFEMCFWYGARGWNLAENSKFCRHWRSWGLL